MKNSKGAMSLSDLGPIAIAFVFVAVVISIGATVLNNVQDGEVTNSAGCNSTNVSGCGVAYDTYGSGLSSLGELSTWLPTIALVIAAAIVIGVLAYFKS